MKKVIIALILTLTLLLGVVGVVSAITDGEPDNGGHPYVGIVAIFSDEGYEWRCSGTLISPTIFLTAGHCTSNYGYIEEEGDYTSMRIFTE